MLYVVISLLILMACTAFLLIRLIKSSIVKLTPEEQRKLLEEWGQRLDGEYFL